MNITIEQKKEFEKIEKKLLQGLQKIFDDINDSIITLRSKKRFPKSEVILVFVFADTMSRIYKILEGTKEEDLDSENRSRFINWLNNFVFTDQNKIYKEHKERIRCDANYTWKLRNSLIHFYGLPKPSQDGEYIGWYGGLLEDRNRIEGEFKKRGEKIKFMHPYLLIKAILNGLLVNLMQMKEMLNQEPEKYIDTVKLAHKIIMQEGAVYVGANKNDVKKPG